MLFKFGNDTVPKLPGLRPILYLKVSARADIALASNGDHLGGYRTSPFFLLPFSLSFVSCYRGRGSRAATVSMQRCLDTVCRQRCYTTYLQGAALPSIR